MGKIFGRGVIIAATALVLASGLIEVTPLWSEFCRVDGSRISAWALFGGGLMGLGGFLLLARYDSG